ncbi:hypothetical protein INT45_001426 [Circinella minor]|uniref:Uncharacterized protein n=1 Tax=Circinella minor TaxID=1195481 RepID=A0A8H7RUG4_9FUNG|nr:hypothetical protein INT45_001426 [Circinella minor]
MSIYHDHYSSKTTPKKRKVVVVGDSGTGKSSLLDAIRQGYPSPGKASTTVDNSVYTVNVNNQLELDLWDIPGSGTEDYERLRPLSYAGMHASVICFSIDSRSSFDSVRDKWAPEMLHYLSENTFVLLALKCDMRNNLEQGSKLNLVSYEEASYILLGLKLAKEINALHYLECSAVENRDIINCVKQIAQVALSESYLCN